MDGLYIFLLKWIGLAVDDNLYKHIWYKKSKISFPVILFAMIYEVYQVEFIQTNLIVFLNSLLAIAVSFFVSLNVIKYFIIYINDIGFYPFMIYRIILGTYLLFFFA